MSLEQITKVYPNGVEAVHQLDLEVADGEFVVLVGPSGCGKTSVLRMVAGLEDITAGTLKIAGRPMNDVPPKDRDIAMVFQNYALYPHMTVGQNIGFALKMRKVPKDQIKAKVADAAAILNLTDHLDRKPSQLSGGQRQRVAMGRAIVRDPSVFLMDEPLSNLDAKLRVQMRADVLSLQKHLGVATLYVTHDQIEAMTMGHRVAVLNEGVLQQYDTPQALYTHPANLFVATFMGSPPMNVYEAVLADDGSRILLGSQSLELGPDFQAAHGALAPYRGRKVAVGIRCENLLLEAASTSGTSRLVVDVDLVEALGPELLVHFQLDASSVDVGGSGSRQQHVEDLGHLTVAPSSRGSSAGVARVPAQSVVTAHERVELGVVVDRLYFFDLDSGRAIAD